MDERKIRRRKDEEISDKNHFIDHENSYDWEDRMKKDPIPIELSQSCLVNINLFHFITKIRSRSDSYSRRKGCAAVG